MSLEVITFLVTQCVPCAGMTAWEEAKVKLGEARSARAVAKLFEPLTYPYPSPPSLADLLHEGERRRQAQKMGLDFECVVRTSWTIRMKAEWAPIMAEHEEQFKMWDKDPQAWTPVWLERRRRRAPPAPEELTSSKKRRRRQQAAMNRQFQEAAAEQDRARRDLEETRRQLQDTEARAVEAEHRSKAIEAELKKSRARQQPAPRPVESHPLDYLLEEDDGADGMATPSPTRVQAETLMAALSPGATCAGIPITPQTIARILNTDTADKNACLCDEALMAGLRLVAKTAGNSGQVKVLEFFQFRTMLSDKEEGHVKLADKVGPALTLTAVNTVVGDNPHWYLAGVHKHGQKWDAIAYDPLGLEDPEGARAKFVQALRTQTGGEGHIIRPQPMLRGPQQTNAVDCGVYVIEMARRIVARADRGAEADTASLREKWALAIMKQDLECVKW